MKAFLPLMGQWLVLRLTKSIGLYEEVILIHILEIMEPQTP
ncbi:hypothetical protein TUMEXPCC7403_06555 [Tumidithrix helvetica PCC 7403]